MATITREEALAYHSSEPHGKVEVVPTKPTATQRDLSLAYTPGVAEPCLAIEKDPMLAYEYTSKQLFPVELVSPLVPLSRVSAYRATQHLTPSGGKVHAHPNLQRRRYDPRCLTENRPLQAGRRRSATSSS